LTSCGAGIRGSSWWYGHELPGRVGLHHHTMFPYGAYECSDGRSVIVASANAL
jgi:crotonobetainyl-CoA:carnitine CoA-transferase CaiB-like acyl-CoA transferase